MKYVGIQTQIRRNNFLSVLLLISFPCILLGMVWVFFAILNYFSNEEYVGYDSTRHYLVADEVNNVFVNVVPWIIAIIGIWFIIAYFANAYMIKHAVGAQELSRRENPRVYNIVENLCMSCGMEMPKVQVVNDSQLNAFASGINKNTYAVTLTTGIIDLLDDDELAGVIGHELTHIRNKDTQLLITSIVFVGIVSTLMTIIVRVLFRSIIYGGNSRSEKKGFGGIVFALVIGAVCCAIAYLFTLLTRFSISRKREYMADAGGAELCGNPLALASALRKISNNPGLDSVNREDVAQLFIMHPDEMESGIMGFMDSLFSTHPDPEDRIAILEQF